MNRDLMAADDWAASSAWTSAAQAWCQGRFEKKGVK
jgi:hypothetical protein